MSLRVCWEKIKTELTMQPRNNIEEKLHAMGYRVFQLRDCFCSFAPNRKVLHSEKDSERGALDDCWTACYQHSQSVETVEQLADERKYQKLVEGMSNDERKACICVVIVEMIKRGETDDLDEETLSAALNYLRKVVAEGDE